MPGKQTAVLFGVLTAVIASAGIGWFAGSRIESPADAAARTAPPKPSPILVPVEKRVLSSNIVTRGTARYGLPQSVSIAPSALKSEPGRIATLPLRNRQLKEGDMALTASGRPLFLLQGKIPVFRDLVPGLKGEDVKQLEEGLARLGFDPGPIDGSYDRQTSVAVSAWYSSQGWEPFGPTRDQLAAFRSLERDWEDADKNEQVASAAAAMAELAVESARAAARHAERAAAADLALRETELRHLKAGSQRRSPTLTVDSERARAEHALSSAQAEVEALIAERALIVLDPRQPETARNAIVAKLKVARAALEKARLEGEMAVYAAEREASLAPGQFNTIKSTVVSAQAAVRSARLESEKSIQAALDARRLAELDARLAKQRAERLAAELETARARLGIQVPADEIVFTPAPQVRVEEVMAKVGDAAAGPVMSVTDNQLAVDSSVALETAPLVKKGMRVYIDERALGVEATGKVSRVASTPGTRGVDGYHFYFEVRVDETNAPLEGFSVRLTIPIESTDGEVTAVPVSALSLSADGTSRVQIDTGAQLEYLVVEPGLTADGYVEVNPRDGSITPGQLVVVGFDNPDSPL